MTGLLIGLLASGALAAFGLLCGQRARITHLERECAKLREEESRMVDFLRELGMTFSNELRLEDLHRLIVQAAMRIMKAHGGALYLANQRGSAVLPAHISLDCPPLVNVPRHILPQAEQSPIALTCFLRRHPAASDDGVIGTAWARQQPEMLLRTDPRLAALRSPNTEAGPAIVAPLNFAGHRLGILAVASGVMGRDFDTSDFMLFQAIAEQSAFALYSAGIYSEAHEKRRLDQDLLVAQDVQRILLPSAEPVVPGFEIHGVNIPASRVSGDYYDYIPLDDHRTGVAIADVSGKGVPASLIMAMCRIVLRTAAPGCFSPAATLHRVNHRLYPDIKEDMFISMVYAVLDDASSLVTLCRAGHDAPLHYSAATGSISRINPPGMVVGIDSGGVFDRIATDFSVTLEKDDCLVLYTDGVTEALDSKGREFGMQSMIETIQASAPGGAKAIIARLTEALRTFIGTYPQNDDITLIAIRKT